MPDTLELKPNPTASTTRPTTRLSVTGMTCGNCARHVTEALQGVDGVHSATVNLEAQQATVRWTSKSPPNVQALVSAVEHEGFGAKPLSAQVSAPAAQKMAGWWLNLLLGIPVTVLLMLGEWVFGLSTAGWFQWLSLVLAGLVQVFAGARFYRGAWNQLKSGSANMDMLVALGSSTAFGFSVWALFSSYGGHLYFMEAAAIITLISAGHWIESRVAARASSALRQLLELAPATARRLNTDGTEIEVPVAALESGQLIRLRPGDRVPTDGEVVDGNSAMDESMLTGESVPVDKTPGSPLYAGTVNSSGRLTARVTATGEETALAHIIASVQRAQASRAETQRLGDRVSSVFVPVVVLIALGAGLWWGLAPASAEWLHARLGWGHGATESPLATAFITAAAVLIIACPCAMGLATPAAIMAGSNAAARRGILIRDGVALEKAGRITTVLFDKTGTLTIGKPAVVEVSARSTNGAPANATKTTVCLLAAALARHSTHPVSRAIAKLDSAELALSDWKEIPGSGVQGLDPRPSALDPRPLLRLGSLPWLSASRVDLAVEDPFIQTWSSQGASIVGLATDKTLLGLFAVKDTLKEHARAVVDQLRRQGLKTCLVTGDNRRTATAIASQAGIPPEAVFAEVRPEQKARFVEQLQRQGERVAFVGDGINDAPALERADLGIAVSCASDIAREAADIILLNSEIEAVPESLGLARATLRTIRQNLFWAFFYNILGIPLAALGFMSPILCAAAMGLSDLVVIGNALRLLRYRNED